jgi:drug/metabolite transporter (DMT)-like permease
LRSWLIPPTLALAWGLNWPAVKIMLTALPPFTMRWIGLGSAAMLLFTLALARRQRLLPARGIRRALTVSGLLNVAAFTLCTAFAQLHTTTSRAAVLAYTMPMMSALLAWALLGERIDRRAAGALVLGSAGIALLAWPALQGLADGSSSWLGLVMPLLAALAWALGTVVAKRWPLHGDRLVNTAWQLLIGAACGALGAWWIGERLPETVAPAALAALAFHVVVATAFAYVLWFVLLERLTATASALTTLMVPVVGVLGAMALVGERPSAADWIGFALVLSGAALILAPWRRAD